MMVHGACFSEIGARDENEDSVKMKEQGDSLAAVVADGLGGQGGGAIASQIVVDCLGELLPSDNYESVLHQRFTDANTQILNQQSQGIKMMSTGVCLYLTGDLAVWAHIGDSRLYHFMDGRLTMQTFDHSVSQMAVFRKEITQGQIRFHEDRNRVLRALGGDEEAKEEMNSVVLQDGFHAFLLCSDGFWEYVLEEEMEDTLKMAKTPEEWLVLMCNLAEEKDTTDRDNFSAAAVFYTGVSNGTDIKI